MAATRDEVLKSSWGFQVLGSGDASGVGVPSNQHVDIYHAD
jgi:hypothetical protein